MKASHVHNFEHVAVGLPCKVRGGETEDDWQEVDWCTWSTGDLSVDGDSYLLVFKPEGAGSGAVKAKPLGNLIRASAVANDGRTVVVSTSDLSKQYRLTFESTSSASCFKALARAAEESSAAAAKRAAATGSGGVTGGESEARLERELRERLADRLPLVFTGSELYGADSNGEPGNEVLLGRGAFVLLDPPGNEAVGRYELNFYSEDDGARSAKFSFEIAHKMTLEEQTRDDDETMVSFELKSAKGTHTIQFDNADVAASFARDFRVRQRVMEMAVKTVKGRQQAASLRSELADAERKTFTARLRRIISFFVVMFLLFCIARVVSLYVEDNNRPVPELFAALLQDIKSISRLSRGAAAKATTQACKIATGAVPAEEVQLCAALPGASQAKQCIEELLAR